MKYLSRLKIRQYMIFVMTLLLSSLVIIGCQSASSYQRDSSEGKVLITSYDEVVEKKNSGKDFVVLFTLVECPYCEDIHDMLATYLNNHNVTIYEVILDKNFDSSEEIKSGVKDDFPDLKGVPTMYYIDDNKIDDEMKYTENDLIGKFDDWVQKHKLDKTQ